MVKPPFMAFCRLPALTAGVMLFCAIALGGAFLAQYGFDMQPCPMCYWQRVPYAVAFVLAALALMARRPNPSVAHMMLWLVVPVLLVSAGLGVYHAGVEWEWWEGPSSCTGTSLADMTLEQIRERIMGAPQASCSEAAFRVLGISMAGWNALYSLAGLVALVYGLRHLPQTETGAAA